MVNFESAHHHPTTTKCSGPTCWKFHPGDVANTKAQSKSLDRAAARKETKACSQRPASPISSLSTREFAWCVEGLRQPGVRRWKVRTNKEIIWSNCVVRHELDKLNTTKCYFSYECAFNMTTNTPTISRDSPKPRRYLQWLLCTKQSL